jgi:hypothetical protein
MLRKVGRRVEKVNLVERGPQYSRGRLCTQQRALIEELLRQRRTNLSLSQNDLTRQGARRSSLPPIQSCRYGSSDELQLHCRGDRNVPTVASAGCTVARVFFQAGRRRIIMGSN